MNNSLSISGFSETFEPLITENRLPEAVSFIFNLAHEIFTRGEYKGVCLRLPELDAGLIQLSNLMRSNTEEAPAPGTTHVCLVTEVYLTGGHRTVLNSICEEIPCHVIFTDLFERITTGKIPLNGLITPKALSSITLNPDSLIGKIQSAVQLLNSLSPKRVWLFNHHQDVVSLLAALIFDAGRRSIFVHHCDHDPGLGATIKFPVHLDFTEELLHSCASIGLDPSLLALYMRSASRRANHQGAHLVVVTAGSHSKFTGTMRGIKYRDVVRTLLHHRRVSIFHHIGAVSDQYIAEFKAFLANSGIDPERMIFAGQVLSVSDYALSVGAQVFLSSFPLGGGATTSEIQSAGIPVVYFDPNQQEKPLCSIASVYASPELEWRQLEDLHFILDKLFQDWDVFSDAAFRRYDKSYSRKVFLRQLEGLK